MKILLCLKYHGQIARGIHYSMKDSTLKRSRSVRIIDYLNKIYIPPQQSKQKSENNTVI